MVLLAGDTFAFRFHAQAALETFLRQMVDHRAALAIGRNHYRSIHRRCFLQRRLFQFNKLGIGSGVGAVVSVAICRELGPVLTGLMVTGRVGAAMSAEIGTMKVTEQIDALRSLAVHPSTISSCRECWR